MIYLQTLPIEATVENSWNTIDEIHHLDSFKDFLQSPTIERFDGLMVRAMKTDKIIETFIWYGERWHDLSSKGKIAKKFMITAEKKIVREHGFAEAWRICANWQSLIYIIDRIPMTRRENFDFADLVFQKCRKGDEYEVRLCQLRREADGICNPAFGNQVIDRIQQAIRQRYQNCLSDDASKAVEYISLILTRSNEYSFPRQLSIRYSCKLAENRACDVLRQAMPLSRIVRSYFAR